MEKRWVVRRSEPVKEVLLIEGKVYPGETQGTIGLRIQNRFNFKKYRCTRTEPKTGTNDALALARIRSRALSGSSLTITKHWYLPANRGGKGGSLFRPPRGTRAHTLGACRDEDTDTAWDSGSAADPESDSPMLGAPHSGS